LIYDLIDPTHYSFFSASRRFSIQSRMQSRLAARCEGVWESASTPKKTAGLLLRPTLASLLLLNSFQSRRQSHQKKGNKIAYMIAYRKMPLRRIVEIQTRETKQNETKLKLN
jgi:hypothetical protein